VNVTCLGTGDAVGVPAPLCDCEYCAESDRRRRPGLLVESGDTTVLLDVPPDVTEGLHATETTSLDGVFATHAHYDHFHGVHELNHTQYERHVWNEAEYDHPHPLSDGLTVYGNDSVVKHVHSVAPHLPDRLDFEPLNPGDRVTVGPLSVEPFPVEHGGPLFRTQGYLVRGPSGDGSDAGSDSEVGSDAGSDSEVGSDASTDSATATATLAYAPDANRLDPTELPSLDLLFVDGSVLGPELHADAEELREQVARVDADRVVPTNVSEHQSERHTADLDAHASDLGYEVWQDFETTTV
jgi:hypothetical protein